jgi:hypothetical protein
MLWAQRVSMIMQCCGRHPCSCSQGIAWCVQCSRCNAGDRLGRHVPCWNSCHLVALSLGCTRQARGSRSHVGARRHRGGVRGEGGNCGSPGCC